VIWCVSHYSAVACEGLPHDLMFASDWDWDWEIPAGKLLA